MNRVELRRLLAHFMAENFGPEKPSRDEDHDPKIEFREGPNGTGTLILSDWAGWQADLCLDIRDENHLRAVLSGETDDWKLLDKARQQRVA